MDESLELPADYDLTLVAAFGHPTQEIRGLKDRKPLDEVAYRDTFGSALDLA